jgi:hypothetical protein
VICCLYNANNDTIANSTRLKIQKKNIHAKEQINFFFI